MDAAHVGTDATPIAVDRIAHKRAVNGARAEAIAYQPHDLEAVLHVCACELEPLLMCLGAASLTAAQQQARSVEARCMRHFSHVSRA